MNKSEIIQIIKKGGVVLIGNKIYDKNNVESLPSEAQIEAATMKGKVDVQHNISLAPTVNVYRDSEPQKDEKVIPISKNTQFYIFAVVAAVLLLILLVPRQTIQILPGKQEAAQKQKKILKFSRLMGYTQRKLLVELPNINGEYDFRVNFPQEKNKAKIDGKVANSIKKPDLLELNFDKIWTNQKEFIIEVFVEYYE